MHYLPLYSPEQSRRHDVLPGMSGWAQVNGRNSITWDEKFQLDIWYINHCSFLLDLKIFCLSVFRVLCRQGINPLHSRTMPPFMGDGVNSK